MLSEPFEALQLDLQQRLDDATCQRQQASTSGASAAHAVHCEHDLQRKQGSAVELQAMSSACAHLCAGGRVIAQGTRLAAD